MAIADPIQAAEPGDLAEESRRRSDESIDVHGVTSSLTAQEVDALVFYLTSIE